jgi:DNA sulfur modification protein DndC
MGQTRAQTGDESDALAADQTATLVETTLAEIRDLYLEDSRPWVIGYSGGKDSNAALQLIWQAIAGLSSGQRTKPVYVIAGDTLVETPVIVDYLGETLERINAAAAAQGMPLTAHKVVPKTQDTFWVNLIGKGYPAPSTRFRWCTERMKINPANRFIRERVAEHGEVIVVLGVRRQESATRAQVMSLRAIKGSLLSRHTKLPNAFVYTPIRDYSVDDVWTYLLQVPSPWGNNNEDLLAMYRNSSAGECPLVVDTSTPSCGNSRFGCWTCTVVTKDKAMEAMIDKGEEWLEPMLELRDFLADTQDPARKVHVRDHVRRNGQITPKRFGSPDDPFVRGPYRLDFCRDVLRRLLMAEAKARRTAPPGQTVELISEAELHAIRRIWRYERNDWADSLPHIYGEVTGKTLPWVVDDVAVFSSDDEEVLDSLCEEHGVPVRMVKSLIDTERELQGLKRRSEIMQRLNAVLGQEWRDEAEVAADIAARETDTSLLDAPQAG